MAATALNGRILVTGGAGFIGSALIWALNARGIDDIVVAETHNARGFAAAEFGVHRHDSRRVGYVGDPYGYGAQAGRHPEDAGARNAAP